MRFDVEITFDASSVEQVVNEQTEILANNMEAVMFLLESEAVQLASIDLGQLRSQRETGVKNTSAEIIGELSFNAEHAAFVHQGTGIYATDGNGRKTPWKWVGHGKYAGGHTTVGQKPNPFLEEAVDKIYNNISEILAR